LRRKVRVVRGLLHSRKDLLRDGVRPLKQAFPTGAELLSLIGDLLDLFQ
jgi:hypothetical protein